jgi:hypothetical protein
VFAPALATSLSQGDLFLGLYVPDLPSTAPATRRLDGIVLSHDCEIDKNQEALLIARFRPIIEISLSDSGNLRAGKVINAMHLPGTSQSPEGLIDFRFTFRIERSQLDRAMQAGGRVASMTPDGQSALQAYLFRFFARALPTDTTPPGAA